MKKFFGLSVFSLIFALLFASCVTSEQPHRISTSVFTDFTASNARSINTSYDMLLVSNDESLSKVYKLTQKTDGQVFYAISDTDWKYNDISAEELADFVVITKDNAKDLVAFIDLLESTFKAQTRKGDGVLYDIAIVRDYTYSEMTVDSITTSSSATSGYSSGYSGAIGTGIMGYKNNYGFGSSQGNAVSRSMKEFKEEDELVRIQLKTVQDQDVLIYAVAGYAEAVSLDDLKTVKAALSK